MCALVLSASDMSYPEWLDPVQKALAKICPAAKVVAGAVDLSEVECGEYCKHRAGCNLLLGLVACDRTITIAYGSPQYESLTDDENPGTVWFQAANPPSDCCADTCGDYDSGVTGAWEPMESEAILAHELIHAWHDCVKASYDYSLKDGLSEEWCTVCGENQVRWEMGLSKRCRYIDDVVECECGSLEGLDPYQCFLLPRKSLRSDCGGQAPWIVELPGNLIGYLTRIFKLFKKSGFPTPEPPEPRDPLADDGWGVEPELREIVPRNALDRGSFRLALRALRLGRRVWAPDIWEDFWASRDAFLLEIVQVALGYRALLLDLAHDRPVLTTNVAPGPPSSTPVLGPQGELVSLPLPLDGIAAIAGIQTKLSALVDGMAAAGEGVSVERGLADGEAHFLWIKRGDVLRCVVVRGFRFFPGDPERGRPMSSEDGARWETIRQAREFSLQLMSDFSA